MAFSYPIWVGFGTLGAVIFQASLSPAKLASVAIILVGVVSLKLTAAA
ncbi:MAG: hypothetical protein AAGL68_05725 [Pseudomonadota bacterium]